MLLLQKGPRELAKLGNGHRSGQVMGVVAERLHHHTRKDLEHLLLSRSGIDELIDFLRRDHASFGHDQTAEFRQGIQQKDSRMQHPTLRATHESRDSARTISALSNWMQPFGLPERSLLVRKTTRP